MWRWLCIILLGLCLLGCDDGAPGSGGVLITGNQGDVCVNVIYTAGGDSDLNQLNPSTSVEKGE